MSDSPEEEDSSGGSDTPTEDQEEESPTEESDPMDKTEDDKDEVQLKQPEYTTTKSAIEDLPSTAVQSIHIENDTPTELEDDVFVWRDVTQSGAKLPAKKCHKNEMKETTTKVKQLDKLPPIQSKKSTIKSRTSTGKRKKTAKRRVRRKSSQNKGKVANKKSSNGKSNSSQSKSKVVSKHQSSQIKERRPSQSKGGGYSARLVEERVKASKSKVVQTQSKKSQSKKKK